VALFYSKVVLLFDQNLPFFTFIINLRKLNWRSVGILL